MKKNILVTLIFLQSFILLGQVGIGTTTPRATLEISNTDNGGLLVPQYPLTGNNDTTTVINPQGGALIDGTLVYNTTDVTGGNALAKGFVYWDATTSTWNEVSGAGAAGGGGGASGGWELNGNNVNNGQFLGSTNFQSLQFRTNNNQVGLLGPNGNIAIGLTSSATGFISAAYGNNAIASNNNATAVGIASRASGQNSSAFGNTANASGQNATAIGFGANAPNATTIILGNTDTNANNFTSSKVGIGTDDPEAKLQVNGSFRYVDTNQAAGRILTSDGNGNATWQPSPIAAPVAIYAQVFKNTSTDGITAFNPVTFGTTSVNNGVNNITNTNIQTAAETGIYRVTYTINVESRAGAQDVEFFATQGFGAANRIPGSSTFASIRNDFFSFFVGTVGNERATLTKSFLVDVNTGFQQFYVFSRTSSGDVRVLNDSSLTVELVYPD